MGTGLVAALTMLAAVGRPIDTLDMAMPPHAAVSICLHGAPDMQVLLATTRTTAIFHRIGVTLHWRCSAGAVKIEMSDHTPDALRPGALAYSDLADGHGVVFRDRSDATVPVDLRMMLLAHVMAHEIGHLLQGV